MVFLKYGEVIFGLILILVVSGQVVAPLWKGTLIFPFFRSRRSSKLAHELAVARQQAEDKRVSQEIKTAKVEKPRDLDKITQKGRT